MICHPYAIRMWYTFSINRATKKPLTEELKRQFSLERRLVLLANRTYGDIPVVSKPHRHFQNCTPDVLPPPRGLFCLGSPLNEKYPKGACELFLMRAPQI